MKPPVIEMICDIKFLAWSTLIRSLIQSMVKIWLYFLIAIYTEAMAEEDSYELNRETVYYPLGNSLDSILDTPAKKSENNFEYGIRLMKKSAMGHLNRDAYIASPYDEILRLLADKEQPTGSGYIDLTNMERPLKRSTSEFTGRIMKRPDLYERLMKRDVDSSKPLDDKRYEFRIMRKRSNKDGYGVRLMKY